MSRKSIKAIGVLVCIVSVLITTLLILFPLNNKDEKTELKTLQDTTSAQEIKIQMLQNASPNVTEIQDYINRFFVIVPVSDDFESMSRAISTAVTPGIEITAFDYAPSEAVTPYKVPESSLDNFKEPFSAGSQKSSDDAPAKSNFTRVPVVISVTAGNYNDLANYTNSLSQQDRLLSVISVDAQTSNSGSDASGDAQTKVDAKIYAYAFVYSK